jgi:flagellar biosynthesis anti-sigma factor FlgM
MRISGQQPHGLDPQELGNDRMKNHASAAGRGGDPGAGKSASATTDAQVEQSTLSLISAGQQPAGDIRTEKVAALKLAIAEGRYQVSDRQIAEAMLRDSAI